MPRLLQPATSCGGAVAQLENESFAFRLRYFLTISTVTESCGCCTNPPVDLIFYLSLNREQNPKILELCLREGHFTDLKRVSHIFPS